MKTRLIQPRLAKATLRRVESTYCDVTDSLTCREFARLQAQFQREIKKSRHRDDRRVARAEATQMAYFALGMVFGQKRTVQR